MGHLRRKYGLAIDNLLSAEVVLASGEVVQASQESEPDLFWAIRGGGGNFGAVTEFCYRAHPLRTVLGGAAIHPLAATAEVFAFYREYTQSLPDEFMVFGGLIHADGVNQSCRTHQSHECACERRRNATHRHHEPD